jgi:hypothetical protein
MMTLKEGAFAMSGEIFGEAMMAFGACLVVVCFIGWLKG